MNSLPVALVTLHEAVDLFGAVAVTAGGCFLWTRSRRKDQRRRVERDLREAEYARLIEETAGAYADTLRCHGGVVR